MPDKKEYWLWWWGIDQFNQPDLHSKPKKFYNFARMKSYSATHSYNHQWLKPGYWSSYTHSSQLK